jgi:hypothetical protein
MSGWGGETDPEQIEFNRRINAVFTAALTAAGTVFQEDTEEDDTPYMAVIGAARDLTRLIDRLPEKDRPEDWGPTPLEKLQEILDKQRFGGEAAGLVAAIEEINRIERP